MYTAPMKKVSLDASIAALGLMAVALLIVVWQQTHPAPEPTVAFDEPAVPCVGSPIAVAYAFKGNPEGPWECRVQCDDDQPRYILYTNGVATQCDTPPSCNDRGEDDGVTCEPPLITPAS